MIETAASTQIHVQLSQEEYLEDDFTKGPVKHQPSIVPNDSELSQQLPKPYKNNWRSKVFYIWETFLVTNPRIHALWLLYQATWPRALVLFDMWTDGAVAEGLYQSGESFFFMLSCVLIFTPFILVWVASLRFVQEWISQNSLNLKGYKGILSNIFLFLYIFPPIGCVVMFIFEIIWVLFDIFKGFGAFIHGKGIIESNDSKYLALKAYRRTIEIFGESIPQTILQSYILLRFWMIGKDISEATLTDLYLSIATSLLNLIINFIRFRKEAKFHGMSIAEYALSVLQLSEIPIAKLVPRLSLIKRGKIDKVNFSSFQFDRESLAPLLNALSNSKSHLKLLKLSLGSLRQLDNESCKMLGNMLKNNQVNVMISLTADSYQIQSLFESMDKDKNGYLDENEFVSAISNVNGIFLALNRQQKQRIFQKMAIRRLSKRDRVYFYDFYNAIMAVDSEEYEFDITQMPFPIHGLIQQICTLWDECNPNHKQKQMERGNSKAKKNVEDSDAELKMQLVFDSNASDETYIIAIDKQVDILSKLYHFCVSAHMINQLSQPLNNHCLYSVLDSFVYVNFSSKQDLSKTHYASVQLTRFVNNIFSDVIKNNRFLNESSNNLAMRNDLFLPKNKLLLSNFMDNVESSFGNDESLFVNDFIKFLTNKNKEEEDARHGNNENSNENEKDNDNNNNDKDDDASSMAETDIDSEYIGPLISGMNIFEYYFCFIVCCKFDNSLINMFCALMNVYFTNYKSETGIDISDVYVNSIVNPNGIFYYLFKFVKTYYNGKYANNLVLLPLKNACNRSDWRSIVDFYCIAVFNGFQFEQGIIDNVSSFENDNKDEEEKDHNRAKSKGRNPFLVDDRELITCANQLITQSGCKPEMLRSLLTSKNFIVNDKRPPTLIEYTVLERVEAFKRNLEDTALATFLDTIEILNEYGCDFTNTNNNLMESAIEFNDVECVKTMIECCRKRDSSILPPVPFMDNDILMDEKKQELNEMNNNGSNSSSYKGGSEMLRKMFGFKNLEAKRRIISKLIYATDVTMMAVLLECPEFAMKDVNDIERITSNFGLLPLLANVSVKKECKLWERFDRDKVNSIKDTAIKLWIRLQAQDQIATENGENGKYGKQVKACKTIVDTICQFCGINTSQEIANIDKKIEEASKKFREYKQLALGTKKSQNEDATNKDANAENASVATNLMRNVVSGNSRRFQGNGFDLDLTYITERIIAMGFPASALEGMYRNNIEDVAKFLSKRHSDKYMVYNLCSEKSYDHKIFDNRVVRFPFDDHNCPCFDDLPAFNEALDEWLSDNSENIAAIHCKNGMGRSGLVIASYLIHTGVWETAKDALKYFGISRTTNQKGVTVPSQRRWVYYYEKYMSLRSRGLTLPQSKWYKFQSIFVSKTCPSFKTCSVYNYEKKFDATNKNIKKTKGGFLITIESTFLINKDVKIQFITGGFRKTRAFSFWFNTMFIENDALKLEKDEIDKVNLDERAKNFYVEMKFEQVESKDKESDGYGDGGDDGAAWGTSQGDNEKKYDRSKMTHEEIVLIGLQLADNIIIRNRTWKREIYQDCFTGTDACKYLMKRLECSKAESIQFGEIFLTNGIISYVKRSDDVNDRQFLDGPFFYRFNYEMKECNENEMTIENVWLKAVSEMNNGNQPQIAVANNVKIENLVSRRRGKPIEKQGLNDTDGDGNGNGNEQAPQLAGQNNQQLFEMMQQRRAFVAQDDDHVSDDGDYSDDSEGFG